MFAEQNWKVSYCLYISEVFYFIFVEQVNKKTCLNNQSDIIQVHDLISQLFKLFKNENNTDISLY